MGDQDFGVDNLDRSDALDKCALKCNDHGDCVAFEIEELAPDTGLFSYVCNFFSSCEIGHHNGSNSSIPPKSIYFNYHRLHHPIHDYHQETHDEHWAPVSRNPMNS